MIHVPFRFLDRIDQVEADDNEPLTYYNTVSGEKEVDDGVEEYQRPHFSYHLLVPQASWILPMTRSSCRRRIIRRGSSR